MFIGRECYKYTEILAKLLSREDVRTRASSKWLQPLLKMYVYLFGIPDIGFQLRGRYVRKIVKHISFSQALDAGCGIGLNSLYLGKKYPSAVIDACDLNAGLVEAAIALRDEQKLHNVNIFQKDLTELSETNKYDLIFCIDVIEHISDDTKLPTKFNRALKDGGKLILSTPRKRSTIRRIKNPNYESAGHVRDGYSEIELNNLLQNNSFKIKEVKRTWGFFGNYCEELYLWTLYNLPSPFAAVIFPILSVLSSIDMVTKNRQGYGLIIVAEKKAVTSA